MGFVAVSLRARFSSFSGEGVTLNLACRGKFGGLQRGVWILDDECLKAMDLKKKTFFCIYFVLKIS